MYRQDPRDVSICGGRSDAGRRVLVVRGDLYSDTGYARATRALQNVLEGHVDRIFGVSLHAHARRRRNAVGFPVVDDAALHENAFFDGAFVLNICLPEHFVRVSRAYNIGYFFWETDTLPPGRFWKARMAVMDRLWAPSRWQSDHLRATTGRAEIPVVPWPLASRRVATRDDHSALAKIRAHPVMTAAELDSYLIRSSSCASRAREKQVEEEDHGAGHSSRFDPDRSPRFGAIEGRPGDLFVAVQTDAARKGLPLLLASWLQFKASDAGRAAKLVVKLSSLDVGADVFRMHFDASLAVRRAARRFGIAVPDVWFIHDRLSDGEMRALLQAADALVTATMGEGFGGPIAEAVIEGTPVIAPRHTSICDLLRADYPLIVASRPHRLELWNNLDVYSAASLWHVVDDASFLDRLATFAGLSRGRRRDIAERAKSHLMAHAGDTAVSRALAAELDRCTALRDARSGSTTAAPVPSAADA